MIKGLNGVTEAELFQEYVYTETGAEIYENLVVGNEHQSVYVATMWVSELPESKKQNVWQMRNPTQVRTITEKVSSEKIKFTDADDLYTKIDRKGYDKHIDYKFKDLIEYLKDNDMEQASVRKKASRK